MNFHPKRAVHSFKIRIPTGMWHSDYKITRFHELNEFLLISLSKIENYFRPITNPSISKNSLHNICSKNIGNITLLFYLNLKRQTFFDKSRKSLYYQMKAQTSSTELINGLQFVYYVFIFDPCCRP